MEKIKTPSFMAIDALSDKIQNQTNEPIEIIHQKVSSKLVALGSKVFVEEYNKAILTKDFSKFM